MLSDQLIFLIDSSIEGSPFLVTSPISAADFE